MYYWNLIIKRGDLDDFGADAMINRQLTGRFGLDVGYVVSAKLDNEVVVQFRYESKRGAQVTLGNWFAESNRTLEGEGDEAAGRVSGYPVGTLLHYREITQDESLYKYLNTRLGG